MTKMVNFIFIYKNISLYTKFIYISTIYKNASQGIFSSSGMFTIIVDTDPSKAAHSV